MINFGLSFLQFYTKFLFLSYVLSQNFLVFSQNTISMFVNFILQPYGTKFILPWFQHFGEFLLIIDYCYTTSTMVMSCRCDWMLWCIVLWRKCSIVIAYTWLKNFSSCTVHLRKRDCMRKLFPICIWLLVWGIMRRTSYFGRIKSITYSSDICLNINVSCNL
jgi:hypothetical protein